MKRIPFAAAAFENRPPTEYLKKYFAYWPLVRHVSPIPVDAPLGLTGCYTGYRRISENTHPL